MKKVITILVFLILTTMFLPSFAFAEEDDTLDPIEMEELISELSQGAEVYETYTETDESWYNSLPVYNGEIIDSKTAFKELKELEKKIKKGTIEISNGEDISIEVVSLKKTKLHQNKDKRFKLWKKANISTPIPIYNFDESIYGYMYGVVDDNSKLLGYIVGGATIDAPPVLEYSLYPDKFLSFLKEDKVYFNYQTGYIVNRNGTMYDPLSNQQFSLSELSNYSTIDEDVSQEYEHQWLASALDSQEYVPEEKLPSTEPDKSTGDDERIQIDTTDYARYNLCSFTSMAMYFDALGRRVEPGLLCPGQPHSLVINDFIHNTYGHSPTFDKCAEIILKYANLKKIGTYITFDDYYLSAIDGSSTNQAVFNKHKQICNTDMPTLVGYSRAAGTNSSTDKGGAHLMMGIGYTTDNFYIVRDTWTYDKTPSRTYYLNKSGYKFCVMGLTYSNSNANKAWGKETLRPGDVSPNVRRLKYMLYSLYYTPGSLTNSTYDSTTEAAVKAFQSDYGLTVDGIVGSGTYSKLKTAHLMKYDGLAGSWRVLSQGKKGDDVAQLQIRLYEMGYDISKVDGNFGSETKAAVKAFQSDKKITSDGIAGSTTIAKIYNSGTQDYIKEDVRLYYKECATCND